jgi:hypothetical protein
MSDISLGNVYGAHGNADCRNTNEICQNLYGPRRDYRASKILSAALAQFVEIVTHLGPVHATTFKSVAYSVIRNLVRLAQRQNPQ